MTSPQEAPHFTKELLIDSMRHLRADFVASLSGEGDDDRARARLAGARRLGLDKVAADAIAAMDKAMEDVRTLTWPGGLDQRYLGLVGVVDLLAKLSTELLPHDDETAHLTELAPIARRAMIAAGSGLRKRIADRFRGVCVWIDPERTNGRDLEWVAEQALLGGATCIRLKLTAATKADDLAQAERLRAICTNGDAVLVIDSFADIAMAARAHGVHVWQADLPLLSARTVMDPWQVIGTANSTESEVRASSDGGADYIGVGPIFPSRGAGVMDTLRAAREMAPAGGPPIVAYGGITFENVAEVAKAGANGIFVAGSVTEHEDPKAAVEALLSAFEEAK